MSQRRKEFLKRQRRNKKVIVFTAVLVVLFFGLGIFWSSYSRYKTKSSIESFIPDDLISLITIDIDKDSKQYEKLKQVGIKLGDEKFFSNLLKDLTLQGINPKDLKIEESLFMGWLGDQVTFGNIRITPSKNSKIFVLEIKNHDLLKDFISVFESNLEQKGYVIERENFRDKEIIQIKKSKAISFTIMQDYLLVSDYPDGIKKLIDTKLGRNKSIAFDKKFKKSKRKLKGKNSFVFAYGDLLELFKSFLKAGTKIDKSFTDKLDGLGENYYTGARFTAEEEGVAMRLYLPEKFSNRLNAKNIKSVFGEVVSSNSAFYTEGTSLKSLLISTIVGESEDPQASFELISRGAKLDYGIDLADVLDIFDGQYAVYLAPEFVNEKIKLALMIDIKDKDDIEEKIHNLDQSIVKLLEKYATDGKKVDIVDKNYKDISYKVVGLPDRSFNLGYFVDSEKLVIFTNEKILKDLNSDKKLSEEEKFLTLTKKKAEQIFYIDVQNVLKLLSNLGEENSTEALGQAAKSLDVIRIIKNSSWTGDFVEADLIVN